MGQNRKIVVVGSSNTDMIIQIDRFPVPGETLLGKDFRVLPGGKGANQAIAAVRLGGDVALVARLGSDLFGDQSLENFRKEGLDVQGVVQDKLLPSGVAQITVDAAGENTILVASGANNALSTAQVSEHAGLLESADFILLQLEIPLETVRFIVEKYGNNGKKLILNPAPAFHLPEEMYAALHAIIPNQAETRFLTGIGVTNEDTAVHAAAFFHEKGVEVVVITLGAAGAFLSSPGFTGSLPAPEANAVDSTAAGDTFIGAIAAGRCSGMDWKDAVIFANRAAALSVTKYGAQSSIPFLAEVQKHF